VDFVNDDNENIEYDSYIVPEEDLQDGALRLLEVDNRVFDSIFTHIKNFLIINIAGKIAALNLTLKRII